MGNKRPEQGVWRSARVERLAQQQQQTSPRKPNSDQSKPDERFAADPASRAASSATESVRLKQTTSGTTTSTPKAPVRQSQGSSSSRWAPANDIALRGYSSGSSETSRTSRLHSSSSAASISYSPMRQRSESRPLGGSLDPMALLASPSRGMDSSSSFISLTLSDSSEPSLGSLTEASTQEQFRCYISDKLEAHAKQYPPASSQLLETLQSSALPPPMPQSAEGVESKSPTLSTGEAERESLEQILLLVRKLREGTVSSGRSDGFTADVYRLSVVLSLLTGNNSQLASSLPRLVHHLDLADEPESPVPRATLKDLSTLLGADSHEWPESDSANSDNARAHTASLLLLMIACVPPGAARLGAYVAAADEAYGGAEFVTTKLRVLSQLHAGGDGTSEPSRLSADAVQHLRLACACRVLLRRRDCPLLRRLLLGECTWSDRFGADPGAGREDGLKALPERILKPTLWQRLIILHAVPSLRKAAWPMLRGAYVTVRLPNVGVMNEDGTEHISCGWLECALLIDIHAFPISKTERQDARSKALPSASGSALQGSHNKETAAPEEWDAPEDEEEDKEDARRRARAEASATDLVRLRRLQQIMHHVVGSPPPEQPRKPPQTAAMVPPTPPRGPRIRALLEHSVGSAWSGRIIDSHSLSNLGPTWDLRTR